MTVVDLSPNEVTIAESPGLPFEEVVVLERLQAIPGKWDDAVGHQNGLGEAIREAHLFRRVLAPEAASFQVDLILRGEVGGRFEYNGALNFLTWFPGPFLLMPNWRGNRYEYKSFANIDLIDARTQQVVTTYHVEGHHKLIHRSPTPFPILGAMIVIPGVARGIQNINPRNPYREAVYRQAYADLWSRLIAQMAAERAPYYAKQRHERIERCGARLNAPPIVGSKWSEFAACQTGGFRTHGAREAPNGSVAVYVNEASSVEVHVKGGLIVRWFSLDRPARRGLPPR